MIYAINTFLDLYNTYGLTLILTSELIIPCENSLNHSN